MKRKILATITLVIFLVSGFTTVAAAHNIRLATDVNEKHPVGTASNGVTVNVGHLEIKALNDNWKNKLVKCTPADAFNIDAADEGTEVTVKATYDVKCEGWWDEGKVSINMTDGERTYEETDKITDEHVGTVEFSFTLYPDQYFKVLLKAKYTDKETPIGPVKEEITKEDYAYVSSYPARSVDIGSIFIDAVEINININDKPKKLDVGQKGMFVLFNADYTAKDPDFKKRVYIEIMDDNDNVCERAKISNPDGSGSFHARKFFKPGNDVTVWLGGYIGTHGGASLYNVKFYWNRPPEIKLENAPSEVKPYQKANFEFTITDPNNDKFSVRFEWGDGTNTGWLGPYASGTLVNQDHAWTDSGSYTLTVRAKDDQGLEAIYNHDLPINRAKSISRFLVLSLLSSFPHNSLRGI